MPYNEVELRFVPVKHISPYMSFNLSLASESSSSCGSRLAAPISTTFYPDARIRPEPEDLALLSSDATLFFVHVTALLSKSSNGFGSLLCPERLRSAPANKYQLFATQNTADVLNLVLCVFYDISVLPQTVHLQDLVAAVDSLAVYGISLQERARPGTPLFQLLATHVAATPIEIYALAASHDLHELAVLASGYSLRTRARDISDDQTTRMGALYLHKLLSLQLGRKQKLKELLRQPPAGHPTTAICNAAGQERLVSAWRLTGAYFMWETGSELTTLSLEVNFGSLVQNISCITCKLACRKRLAEVLCSWDQVKRTI